MAEGSEWSVKPSESLTRNQLLEMYYFARLAREIEDHGRATAVLPYDPTRRVALLVEQFRTPAFYAAGVTSVLEVPAGLLDESEPEEGARREAFEETGIAGLALHPTAPRPLDVDVHDIPARGDEPAHQHLDLRYLVLAPPEAALARSAAESDDLRWFGWNELERLDLDPGLRRALAKARAFF